VIPNNITADDIRRAITRIQAEGYPAEHESTRHDLLFEGSRFPPKIVLSYANVFANDSDLSTEDFSGGPEANEYLRSLGYEIVPKRRTSSSAVQGESKPLSQETFQKAFDRFKNKVGAASGVAFKSFHEGLPAEWESYKPPLRARALEIMGADTWVAEDIGSGGILNGVISAIEIQEPEHRNNLVRWENRFGHANRSHHKLLDALDSPGTQTEVERLLFGLYEGEASEAEAFEQLRSLLGSRYDLLAYLFFLKDSERFLPIAPTTFDRAFEFLGIDLVTTRRCSWDNYAGYNDALFEVRKALIEIPGLKDAQLIDAHSFCWMLVQLPEEGVGTAAKQSPTIPKAKRDSGRVLGARETSVVEMAQSVEKTVRGALGPPVEKSPKPKELRMSRQQLEQYIKQLLLKQEERCALTGIPIQFRGEQVDDLLLPSLDRIDSNGHYEVGNLQVVCRFINFWKGAQDDEEFLRLLALVRGDADDG